jgi:maltoporin
MLGLGLGPEAAHGESSDSDGPTSEFSFGSYGRVQFDFDEDGNRGRQTNVVRHGPRLLEEPYAELDLSYKLETDEGFGSRVLFTLALMEPFAHFSGDFSGQALAVRNLYAESWGFLPALEGLELWVGSRMYRGDDVYLLDYWPLDELNTVGGGVVWRTGGLDVRAHVGVNRLDDDYQFQSIEVPGQSYQTRRKVILERQRTIGSVRAAYKFDLTERLGAKAVVYGEYHSLPAGRRIPSNLLESQSPVYPEEIASEPLPADHGSVVGGQIGLFGKESPSHLNLFVKRAQGLGAYGEFGVPAETAADGRVAEARALTTALSGNLENETFGLMAGGYLRRFRDPDDQRRDNDDYLEGALALRPLLFLTRHFHQGLEISYQSRHPFGLEPKTGEHRTPSVLQLSALEIVSLDRGSYARPQLRLQYTLSLSNEDARARYPEGDVRRPEDVEHFIGVGAEWWFNSSRYQ